MSSRSYDCGHAGAIRVSSSQNVSIYGDNTIFANNIAVAGGKDASFRKYWSLLGGGKVGGDGGAPTGVYVVFDVGYIV